MRVVSRRRLRLFWERHPDSEQPLRAWYAEVKRAAWKRPADIKARYVTASFVGTRVVFNIGGNKHRLVVVVHFKTGKIYVRFVGTHDDYNHIDVAKA